MKAQKIKIYATLGLGLIFLVICIFSLISDSKINSKKTLTFNKQGKPTVFISSKAQILAEDDSSADSGKQDYLNALADWRERINDQVNELQVKENALVKRLNFENQDEVATLEENSENNEGEVESESQSEEVQSQEENQEQSQEPEEVQQENSPSRSNNSLRNKDLKNYKAYLLKKQRLVDGIDSLLKKFAGKQKVDVDDLSVENILNEVEEDNSESSESSHYEDESESENESQSSSQEESSSDKNWEEEEASESQSVDNNNSENVKDNEEEQLADAKNKKLRAQKEKRQKNKDGKPIGEEEETDTTTALTANDKKKKQQKKDRVQKKGPNGAIGDEDENANSDGETVLAANETN